MREKQSASGEPRVPAWLWRGSVSIFVIVVVGGFGLAAALALGWRSPVPGRAPDWTMADIAWMDHSEHLETCTNDVCRMQLSETGQYMWTVASTPVTDFDVELEVHSMVSSDEVEYGLLYRYQDAENHYVFGIGSDGYYTIAIVREGELVPLRAWQQWPHVRRGAATNRLRTHCKENICRFYINGEFTAEISDSTLLHGKLGLWARSYEGEAVEVVFDEIRVWSLD